MVKFIGEKVIEMYQTECHEFTDRDAVWMMKTRKDLVTLLNPVQFELLLEKCKFDESSMDIDENRNDTSTGDHLGVISDEFFNFTMGGGNGTSSPNATKETPIVFPGTKWCGRGDTARSYDDLGLYAHTDRCCRDHDNCPDHILSGESKHGLQNNASFTSSHCECDDKFLQCLKDDTSLSRLTSSKIAHIYFNILKPYCFDERHPVTSCQQRRLTGECIRPAYDYREARQWQFFDAQPYFAKTVRSLLDKINTVFGATEAPVADPSSHSGRRAEAMPPGFTF